MAAFVGFGGLSVGPRCRGQARVCTLAQAGKQRRGTAVSMNSGGPVELSELTQRLGELLRSETERGHDVFESQKQNTTCNETTEVVVVLGKTLIRDQLTVEYAKRVMALLNQLSTTGKRPSVVCFVGCKGEGLVSEAAAGYSFFRSFCEQSEIDISDLKFVLLETSYNKGEALRDVFRRINDTLDKKVLHSCHFTFISSDYHLFRVQEIHRLNPARSVLRPLVVAESTWDFVYAAYPFCVSSDATTAFLGRVTVLTSDLYIVWENLEAVLDDKTFFARENWERLNATVAKIRRFSEMLFHPTAVFHTDMRPYSEALDECTIKLREAQKIILSLIKPETESNEMMLKKASNLVLESIHAIRRTIDPDRPVTSADIDALRSQMEVESIAKENSLDRLEIFKMEERSSEALETSKPRRRAPKKATRTRRQSKKDR